MKERLILGLGVLLCVAASIPACGGSVVFEEDGAGGTGGSGNTSSKSGSGKSGSTSKGSTSVSGSKTNSSVTTDVGTTSGGCSLPDQNPPTNCPEACSDLFDCGLLLCDNQTLCPGFFQIDKPSFMMGCVPQCMQQMALISIIDPSGCDVTIETVKSISFDFAQQCEGFDDG